MADNIAKVREAEARSSAANAKTTEALTSTLAAFVESSRQQQTMMAGMFHQMFQVLAATRMAPPGPPAPAYGLHPAYTALPMAFASGDGETAGNGATM